MSVVFPRATYRLQLHRDFTFDDAAGVAPYVARLGASHLYLSPVFTARPGSMHGYDILDHGSINPELGGEEGFMRLARRCRENGLGIILDFVPNHMGVGGDDNPLWKDVLEWGQDSPYAAWFDIDWTPQEQTLKGRVLLPFLGRPYGDILSDGEIGVAADPDSGTLSFTYFEHRFPLAPHTYASVLAGARAEALSALAGGFAGLAGMARHDDARAAADALKRKLADAAAMYGEALDEACARAVAPGDDRRAAALHGLLEAQHYRLAFWRVAADEINYRRFFDINGLAGLRVERADAFAYAHRCLLRLVAQGDVQGVRLDHIDGLYDPAGYCHDLQRAAAAVTSHRGEATLYLLAEKILAPHESLPESWPIHGATGYEFMALTNAVLTDPSGEDRLDRAYRQFTGRRETFEEMLETAKRQILRNNLAGELGVIAHQMHRIAKASWRTRDFTIHTLREALRDVFAAFPVYRTYVSDSGVSEQDRRYIDWAIARGKKTPGLIDDSVYDFIAALLKGEHSPAAGDEFSAADAAAARRRFEQTTPPVMAKSMEDTAFYRYARLISLNEVGGDPARFALSPAAFHAACRRRQETYPGSLNASATHDHKRGEDARMRIGVLSELPQEWARAAGRWTRMNRALRGEAREGETLAPSRNDEYFFYQSLVGAWPLDLAPDDAEGLESLAGRLDAYMQKAAREAKEATSWAAPREEYEQALSNFVRGALDPARGPVFLASVHAFVEQIAPAGAVKGLAQTVLKCMAPGAPDIYQGAELWDFSLVDPDNRRPVDYDARLAALGADDLSALAAAWRDGRVKQTVLRRLLRLRAEAPDLFAEGDHLGVEIEGPGADRTLAFERRLGEARVVAVVPRLCAQFVRAGPLSLDPAGWTDTRLKDCDLSGGRWIIGGAANGSELAALFAAAPVEVWTNLQD